MVRANEIVAKVEKAKFGKDPFFKKMSFSWVGTKHILGTQNQAALHLTDCMLKHFPDPVLKERLKGKKGDTYGYKCSKAYQFAIEMGLAEEAEYPFVLERRKCKSTTDMWYVFVKLVSGNDTFYAYLTTLENEEKIVKIAGQGKLDVATVTKEEVQEHIKRQPLTYSVDSYPSLTNFVGQGVHMGPTEKETANLIVSGENPTSHSMLIVGYGRDDKFGEDYLLVQSSWGRKWGYSGYAKIKPSLVRKVRYPVANKEEDMEE